jgi:adenine C2-methylase RlmN of 23S rRNA A2503 and tRNA A37
MGLERNLSAGEIVGQVLFILRAHGLSAASDRINIVMMGMGEPLLNLPNVVKATRILTDPAGMAISPRRITLSTSGIIPKIVELAHEPVRPKLAISLNASNEQQRQRLMPITRSLPFLSTAPLGETHLRICALAGRERHRRGRPPGGKTACESELQSEPDRLKSGPRN